MKRLWLLFAQAVTLLAAGFAFMAWVTPDALPSRSASPAPLQSGPQVPGPAAAPPTGHAVDTAAQLREAARSAMAAVVSINTEHAPRQDPWSRLFGRQPDTPGAAGLGSGVIVNTAGIVLTNFHVIQGARQIEVVLHDGRSSRARVVGADPETDLAVLQIAMERLPAITLGDSDALRVGDRVLAIGNPFGVGQTVTSGIVSAVGRNQLGLSTFEDFIQTDAEINPGNSGGALVDAHGHLVGINTAIYSRSGGAMGIGFAIPVATAKLVLEGIVKEGTVTRGWIGVQSIALTPDVVRTLRTSARNGVAITGVLRGSPAEKAGLRAGDVVGKVAGKAIASTAEFLTAVSSLRPGQPAPLQVWRGRETLDLTVTPIRRPTPPPAGR